MQLERTRPITQPRQVTRKAQALPLSEHDKRQIGRMLNVGQWAEENGLDPVVQIAAIIAELSPGAQYLLRRAHVDDVIQTALAELPPVTRKITIAVLQFSHQKRGEARALARRVIAAIPPTAAEG